MVKEDALLCFSRHATSKIKDDQDLFCIQTLGFRGEAIPSIASISNFELKTLIKHQLAIMPLDLYYQDIFQQHSLKLQELVLKYHYSDVRISW